MCVPDFGRAYNHCGCCSIHFVKGFRIVLILKYVPGLNEDVHVDSEPQPVKNTDEIKQ